MLRTKAAHVRREISLNRYYREEPLFKLYVISIIFLFAIIRHIVILQNNHSKIENSILPYHQFHVTSNPHRVLHGKISDGHFRIKFEAVSLVALSYEMLTHPI